MYEEEKFLDVEKVAKYVCLSKSFIYKKVCRNEIPHYKIGSRTLFDRTEVDQWIKGGMSPVFQTKFPKLPKL